MNNGVPMVINAADFTLATSAGDVVGVSASDRWDNDLAAKIRPWARSGLQAPARRSLSPTRQSAPTNRSSGPSTDAGLRWGEAAALRVGSIDPLRRRLRVTEAVTEVQGRQVWGTPKSHAARTVPLPRFLADVAHVAERGLDELVFPSTSCESLRVGSFRRSSFDVRPRTPAWRAGRPY